MAGGGASDPNNPLPMNVVPLIDIIFCLLLFFMCSFHFRALEGRFEAWLPADRGLSTFATIPPPDLAELRVRLELDDAAGRVVRRVGRNVVASDQDLAAAFAARFGSRATQDSSRASKDGSNAAQRAPRLVIDVAGGVPWQEVVTVLDFARAFDVQRAEFALARSSFEFQAHERP